MDNNKEIKKIFDVNFAIAAMDALEKEKDYALTEILTDEHNPHAGVLYFLFGRNTVSGLLKTKHEFITLQQIAVPLFSFDRYKKHRNFNILYDCNLLTKEQAPKFSESCNAVAVVELGVVYFYVYFNFLI